MKKLLPTLLALLITSFAFAQLTLGTSPYAQNFDAIGGALPTGFTVRAGATATALGTIQSYSGAMVAWNNTAGAFKNFASATGLASGTTGANQNLSTNRTLGIRQTGTLGDPGGAFVIQLANTVALRDFKMTFNLQSLDITSPRTTTWRVDYGFTSSPASFTAATTTGTLTTGGSTFTNNTINVDFGSALNNQPGDVWIRIVTITASGGSGNRASSSIDDLSITYNTGFAPSFSTSLSNILFGNVGVGTNSAAQSFTLNYSNLDGSNVTVATAAPFSVSKVAGGPYSTSLVYTSAELGGSSTTIYGRYSPLVVGPASGSISVTGGGVSGASTVSLTGTGVSLNPVANADSYSGFFGDIVSGNVATNDSDPQALSLTYSKLSDPAAGTLTFNPDGTFSYQSVEGSSSPQTFTYRATNTIALFADAAVTITLVEKPKIFISQYYEGTSVNKWIELTNPTSSPVNLASPQLRLGLYSISGDAGNIVISGAPTQSMNLTITIPAKSSVLIGNTGNGAEVPYLTAASAAQSNNAVINFNGNDGVALLDAANNIVDAFGTGVNAKDVSYVRNQDAATPSAAFIVADWTRTALSIVQNAADLDDPDRLGAHVQPELPPCVAPSSQPTDLSFSSVGTKTISLNFTPSVANEYLVVRSLSNSLSADPADGTIYNTGNSLGGGTVAGRIVNGSLVDSNLAPGTTYYYFIYALNSVACDGGPVYLTANPLAGTQATVPLPPCATPPSQPTNFAITFSNYNIIQGTFAPAAGAEEFLVVMSEESTLTAPPVDQVIYAVGDLVGGGIVIKKGASGTFNRSGLEQDTDYFFYIFSLNSNCSGGPLYLSTDPLTGTQKTAIFDPNALNYYYGNLHSHSSYSDGNKDDLTKKPEDDYAFAKNSMKMDFLGISEHNHTQAGMHLASWQPGIVAAQNATTPDFVAMHGMEWGVISGGGHVIVYGLDSLAGWEPGEYQIFVPKNTYTGATGLFNIINRHGLNAIATLAHPNTTDYNNLAATYNEQADNAIVGSALESGPAFSTNVTYSDPPSSLAYLSYYNKMLARGYHLGANIDHDNHNLTFGRHTRGRTVVLAPSLTENDLLDAMKKMRFYASEDSEARISYTVNGELIGSVFAGPGSPRILVSGTTASPVASITIVYGTPGSGNLPTTLVSSAAPMLDFTDNTLAHLATGYYYADILEEDGSRIITSPIWYTRNDSLRSEQTITFTPLTSATYGDPDFNPAATSTNATIPVTYTSSDITVAEIVNNQVHILKAGAVDITAHQAGNVYFKPAASVTQSLLIGPRQIAASAEPKTKVYGDADPELTYTYTPSLVGADAFAGALTRDAGENVGNYVVSQGTLALTSNYVLTVDASILTVTAKPIEVSAQPVEKVYGTVDPEFTYTFTPLLIAGDVFAGALTREPGESVGSYAISQGTLALNNNYTLTVIGSTFTIVQKGLVITAEDKSRSYDSPNPEFTATYEGFVNGEDASALSSAPAFATTATQTSSPGVYPIAVDGAAAVNYVISYVEGSLTVGQASQIIGFGPLPSKTFGDLDFALTATGGASGNPVTFASSNSLVATVENGIVHIIGAGTTTITASQAGNSNYTAAADVALSLTVNKAAASITLGNLSQTFDGTPKAVTVTTSPAGLDVVTVLYNGLGIPPTAAGTYSINATLNNANYTAAPAVATLTITPPPQTLKVQYRNADGSLTNNEGKPFLKIVNTGASSVPYSQLTARYWIKQENFTGMLGMWIDWAQIGGNKVMLNYVILSQPRVKAFGYIEYSFTASSGSLAANSNSGEIQSRFANSDWSTFNEANDHSLGANGSYADNSMITLYKNGVLVWGTEPAAEAPQVSLKIFSQAKGQPNSNTISTWVDLKNDGNVAVNYGDVTARYWLTSDGASPLNFWVDYAKVGNGAISGSFVALSPVRTNANVYLELKVMPAATTFYPLASTGNIQYRITKADWSNFSQVNDYSYQAGAMAENPHITIYYQGQLVYGTEPAGPSVRVAMDNPIKDYAAPAASDIAPLVFPNPSSGRFALQMTDERSGSFKATMFNSVGKAIDTYSGEKRGNFLKEYDLQLAPGLYLMMINWEGQDHTDHIKVIVRE